MPDAARPIIANVPRLEEYMERHRLAAVVARSGQNFTYLAGFAYPGTLARHLDLPDSMRGVLLVWPRRGEPVIVLERHRRGPHPPRLLGQEDRGLRAYTESPYRRLGQVLEALGLARERVGFEKNYVSAAHWEDLQGQLCPSSRWSTAPA